MKVRYNNLGNIHIPKIMAKSIGLQENEDVDIECDNDRIIISTSRRMRSKEEIKKFVASISQYDDDITKGMIQMAEWILYEDKR